jgi:hypothetical protein
MVFPPCFLPYYTAEHSISNWGKTDESGEDYLYPQSYFILVQLPRGAQEALQVAG